MSKLSSRKQPPPPPQLLSFMCPTFLASLPLSCSASRTAPPVTVKAVSFKPKDMPSLSVSVSDTLCHAHTCSDTQRESDSRQLLICYVADRTVMNFL